MNDRDVASTLENEDAIVAAHTAMCREFADLLVFIAEHDRREAWRVDGARSMADWVSYRLGYSDRHARDRLQRPERSSSCRPSPTRCERVCSRRRM